MKSYFFNIFLLLCLVGCISVRESKRAGQPVGVLLTAKRGDIVIHIDRKETPKKIFGKSFIFAKANIRVGFVELKYSGVTDPGNVVFDLMDTRVIDTTAQTNAPASPGQAPAVNAVLLSTAPGERSLNIENYTIQIVSADRDLLTYKIVRRR